MFHLAASFWTHDIFHPLNGNGYQFWSGIAGSFITGGGIWTGVVHGFLKHNCHVHRCLRIGKFDVEGTPFRVCRKHHQDVPDRVTEEHLS